MKKQKKQQQSEQPFWTSTKFKKLQQKWYKKLAKEGFADIEQHGSADEWLKTWHNPNSGIFAKQTLESLETRQSFYAECRHALNKPSNFDSKWELWVWRLYSEGLSISEIEKKARCPFRVGKAVKKLIKRIFGRDIPGYHKRRW